MDNSGKMGEGTAAVPIVRHARRRFKRAGKSGKQEKRHGESACAFRRFSPQSARRGFPLKPAYRSTGEILMPLIRIGLATLLAAAVVVLPALYYRARYDHTKRLRPVDEGVLYRCGLLTADGFADAIERY